MENNNAREPHLPRPNDRIVLFGLDVVVAYVEPYDDWTWHIECIDPKSGDLVATTRIASPTRTV